MYYPSAGESIATVIAIILVILFICALYDKCLKWLQDVWDKDDGKELKHRARHLDIVARLIELGKPPDRPALGPEAKWNRSSLAEEYEKLLEEHCERPGYRYG